MGQSCKHRAKLHQQEDRNRVCDIGAVPTGLRSSTKSQHKFWVSSGESPLGKFLIKGLGTSV